MPSILMSCASMLLSDYTFTVRLYRSDITPISKHDVERARARERGRATEKEKEKGEATENESEPACIRGSTELIGLGRLRWRCFFRRSFPPPSSARGFRTLRALALVLDEPAARRGKGHPGTNHFLTLHLKPLDPHPPW